MDEIKVNKPKNFSMAPKVLIVIVIIMAAVLKVMIDQKQKEKRIITFDGETRTRYRSGEQRKFSINKFKFNAPAEWSFSYLPNEDQLKISNGNKTVNGFAYKSPLSYQDIVETPNMVKSNLEKRGIHITDFSEIDFNQQKLYYYTGKQNGLKFDLYIKKENNNSVLVVEAMFENNSLYNSKTVILKTLLSSMNANQE